MAVMAQRTPRALTSMSAAGFSMTAAKIVIATASASCVFNYLGALFSEPARIMPERSLSGNRPEVQAIGRERRLPGRPDRPDIPRSVRWAGGRQRRVQTTAVDEKMGVRLSPTIWPALLK